MRRIAILCYHRIIELDNDLNMICVSPKNFESHIKAIKKQYDILPLSDPMQSWFEGERDAVIITFDDGYYDLYQNAFPILNRYHVPATMFIATRNVGKQSENWTDILLHSIFSPKKYCDRLFINVPVWKCSHRINSIKEKVEAYGFIRELLLRTDNISRNEIISQLVSQTGIENDFRIDRRMMSVDELNHLAASDLISIGGHTINHCALKGLSEADQKYEINGCKKELENYIGKDVNLFSFPFGQKNHYDQLSIEVLKKSGFEKAVTTISGLVSDDDCFQLKRFNVRNYDERGFKLFLDSVFERPEEHVVQSIETEIAYVGSLKNDLSLFDDNKRMIIWGCGFWGEQLYWELCSLGVEKRIIGWGDNDSTLWGKDHLKLPVLSEKELDSFKEEDIAILVKNTYYYDIVESLIQKGFCGIHILSKE